VLDSQAKELRYYSEVPSLPLQNPEQLKTPKEVIKLTAKNKLNYLSAQGIGEVIIVSIDPEGKKEWHLTMGSRKMVKEFGIALEEVRTDKYIGPRQLKRTLAHLMDEMFENKAIKIDTPFISQIEQL
jgi:hypothetical protein